MFAVECWNKCIQVYISIDMSFNSKYYLFAIGTTETLSSRECLKNATFDRAYHTDIQKRISLELLLADIATFLG